MWPFKKSNAQPEFVVPSPGFMSDVNSRTDFTPDVWKLEKRYFHNVFIYNELMTNSREYSEVMEGKAVKLAAAYTADDTFVMYKKAVGKETFPFTLKTTPDMKFGNSTFLGEPAHVMGQLFTMRPGQVIRLDTHLLNTVQFERVRVKICIPFRYKNGSQLSEPMVKSLPAWMYVGRYDWWADLLLNKKLYPPVKFYSSPENQYRERLNYYFFNESVESNST
jgi:hypothetical protein